MISASAVRDVLRFHFGPSLADDPDFCSPLLTVLSSYVPSRDTMQGHALRVEDCLFNLLYNRLGLGMTLSLEGGVPKKIRLSDLPAVTDAVLYPFFLSLIPGPASYEQLRSYWISSGSASAMRALYLRFPQYLPMEEKSLIERIVRENIPISLQDAWLNQKDVLNL